MFATQSGRTDSLKALIDAAGAEATRLVCARDNHGNNAMAYALAANSLAACEVLWDAGEDVTAAGYGEMSKNVLMYALEQPSNDAPEKVLARFDPKKNVVLPEPLSSNATVVLLAQRAVEKKSDLFEQLLRHRDIKGLNALMYALVNGKQPMIKRMLRPYANNQEIIVSLLAARDNQGRRLLFYSIKYAAPMKFLQWQLSYILHQKKPTVVFNKHLLPLFRQAVAINAVAAAEFLLKYDGSKYAKKLLAANTSCGITALTIAAKRGQLRMVNFLLNQGGYGYPNAGYTNKTAITFAQEHGHSRVVERLTQYAVESAPLR